MQLRIPGQRVHHTYRTAEGVEMVVYGPAKWWQRALTIAVLPFGVAALVALMMVYGLLALIILPVKERLFRLKPHPTVDV